MFAKQRKAFLYLSNEIISFLLHHFFASVSQVNEGVILYGQNKLLSVGRSATDAFSFTVSSPPAFLPPHTFTILISYQAKEHHDSPQHKTRLLNNAGTVQLCAKNLSYFFIFIVPEVQEDKLRCLYLSSRCCGGRGRQGDD